MDFDLQIAHSVQEIGQEAWERLGNAQPFTSYRWYRFGEMVLKAELPIYIILSRKGEPLARATFWLKRQEHLPIPSRPVRRLMEEALRRWPFLMCQTPLSSTSGLLLPDPPLQDAALQTITRIAYDQIRQHNGSFIFCPYLRQPQILRAGWPTNFAPVIMPNPGTSLAITWPDFDSYLKHLSKSARKDYRRHCNRAADHGIVVTAHESAVAIDEALVLIRNVENHHGTQAFPWARAMLENSSMVEATWLTAKIEDRLVGCGLVLGDRDTRFLALLGLDYDVRYAYFQLVYAAIRCTIEGGFRLLRGGGGAYEIKQRLGFQLEDNNHVFFAGRGPVFRRLGLWAANFGEGQFIDLHED
jgi:predicted N-acyltransferase